MIHVTSHAIQRYQERVANLPRDLVIAALNHPRIQRAAMFGCPSVILGTGQRVILSGHNVVTIKPKGSWRGSLDPHRRHPSNIRYREIDE